jgi:hypothetical protein
MDAELAGGPTGCLGNSLHNGLLGAFEARGMHHQVRHLLYAQFEPGICGKRDYCRDRCLGTRGAAFRTPGREFGN